MEKFNIFFFEEIRVSWCKFQVKQTYFKSYRNNNICRKSHSRGVALHCKYLRKLLQRLYRKVLFRLYHKILKWQIPISNFEANADVLAIFYGKVLFQNVHVNNTPVHSQSDRLQILGISVLIQVYPLKKLSVNKLKDKCTL